MSVDIWSKSAVSRAVLQRVTSKKVRDCQFLAIELGSHNAFFSRCTQQFAERERANDVPTDMTGYRAPSSYYWPVCPSDCPLYEQDLAFANSLARGRALQSQPKPAPPYVDEARIDELRALKGAAFDSARLIRLCVELNLVSSTGAVMAIAMLVRAIVDHIPPVFGKSTFSEVANNYSGQSFKKSMHHLDLSLRPIADSQLHVQIRAKETVPVQNQVDFRQDLDVLLQEVARVLKSTAV